MGHFRLSGKRLSITINTQQHTYQWITWNEKKTSHISIEKSLINVNWRSMNESYVLMNPDRRVQVGSGRKTPGNHRNVEAVFSSEKFRNFFRRIPVLSDRNLPEVIRKMSEKFPAGILLPRSVDFWCFPAGTKDFFPALSCRFLQYSAAGTIDLGR